MQGERERAGKQGVRLGLTLSAVGIEAVGGLLRGEEGKKPKYTKCMGDVRVCKVSTSELLTANVILHCQGSSLLASPVHTGRRKRCLGPRLKYTATRNHKRSLILSHANLRLCWASLTAILGCMRSAGCRLDTPDRPPFSNNDG